MNTVRHLTAKRLGFALLFITLAWPCRDLQAQSSAPIELDIPAGPLATALNRLVDESGLQIVYEARLTEGLQSRRVAGRYTPEAALRELLAGTELDYHVRERGTVTLERATRAIPAPQPEPLAEAETKLKKASEKKTDIVLPEMTVTASPLDETSYNPPNATSGTKTDTPIMETPLNIQVIPQQVLRDQQVVRIEKALQNVSGVYTAPSGGTQTTFLLRGFKVLPYYVDGVRVFSGQDGSPFRETANIEQIEVLKGPASILYGRIDPGGLVSVVRKQPLAQPYYALAQQFGSFDFYRTTIDATGPITKDDTLLYRMNVAYENAGSFCEFNENERVFLAPVLRWNISPQTQAKFYLEYLHSRDPVDQGLVVLGTRPAPVPRERNLGEPGQRLDFDEVRVGFNWSHAFNEQWSLRQHFDTDLSEVGVRPNLFAIPPDSAQTCTPAQCPLARFIVENTPFENQIYYTSLDLTGKFDTWGIGHILLLGGDYLRFDTFNAGRGNFSVPSFIDLFHPVHTGLPLTLLDQADFQSEGSSTEDWYGFYVQDPVRLPHDLHVLAGFRYDNAASNGTSTILIPGPPTTSTFSFREDAVTPRFGLLWQPVPQLSLYGNYVENFGRTNGFSLSRTPLPPETAQQWEFGLKTELFDGRLTTTLAWFDLTRQNIAAPDPDPILAAQGFSVAVGEANNNGLEFDVSGEIWRI